MKKNFWGRYFAHVAIFVAAYFLIGLPAGLMLHSGTWASWIGRIAGAIACFLYYEYCEYVDEKRRQQEVREYACDF